MNSVKNIFKHILYFLLRPFGPAFSDPKYSPIVLLKHVLIQKLFRINGHVPWPVHWTSRISCPEKIKRGTRLPGISPCCVIDGRNGVSIGENVWIGPHVKIISMNHDVNNFFNYVKEDPIIIGDNCWLGTGTTILPGAHIGNHVICAAGSVVTKSFKENNIMLAGVPAKIVKKLAPYKNTF